jgi:putative SOS response-associated peptidase YedK
MCNLYSQTKGQDAIRGLFRVANDRTGNLPPFPAVFPDPMAPIVRNAALGRELVLARWGMPGAEPSRLSLAMGTFRPLGREKSSAGSVSVRPQAPWTTQQCFVNSLTKWKWAWLNSDREAFRSS